MSLSGQCVAIDEQLPTLVVDLTDRRLETWSELWDALAEPCELPPWFGRNLHAWWDTIQTRNISQVVDEHYLIVTVRGEGLFAPTADGQRFVDVTKECDFARVRVVSP